MVTNREWGVWAQCNFIPIATHALRTTLQEVRQIPLFQYSDEETDKWNLY